MASAEQPRSPRGGLAAISWATWLIGAGAVAGPLAFGATEVWAYCGLQGLVAAAFILWGMSRDRSLRRIWLPLAVVGLGGVQLISLPGTLLSRLAPYGFKARQEIDALVDSPTSAPISVNAARTEGALRRCLMLAAVVVICADAARDVRRRQRLIRCVAATGAIVLLLGLVAGPGWDRKALGFHEMDGTWKFYKNPLLSGFHSEGMGYADEVLVGRIPYVSNSAVVGTPVGALINANHFAACVGLTLPLVVWLFSRLAERASSKKQIALLTAIGVALLGIYAIAIKAHARGATAALGGTVGVLVCLRLFPSRRGTLLTGVALLLAIAGAGAAAYGLAGPKSFGGRAETWRAAIEMFRASPWFGVGLGNYATVYPALRNGPVAYLAHSAWLETVAEAGLAGLLLVAVLSVWFATTVGRVWAWNVSGTRWWTRIALLGGILFAALHGAVDHGVQVPGNAYLCAVLLGILLGDVQSDQPVGGVPRHAGRWSRMGTVGLALGIAAFLVYGGVRETLAERGIMPLRRAIDVQRVPEKIGLLDEKPDLLRESLPEAMRAFDMRPHDATFADYIGQAFLHLSRGKPGSELRSAEDWFRRSLQLCPVNPWTERTLRAIRDPENFGRRPAEEKRRKLRSTNARPGRSEP